NVTRRANEWSCERIPHQYTGDGAFDSSEMGAQCGVILNTVPHPLPRAAVPTVEPPCTVVPCRFPFLSMIRPPKGFAPSVPAKPWSTVSFPNLSALNTIPQPSKAPVKIVQVLVLPWLAVP